MKTFRFLGFVLSAILLCLSACSKGEDDPITPPTPKPEDSTPTITLDSSIQTSGLSFEASASEKSISFTTNSDWTLSIAEARSGTDWCKASPTSGGKGTANVKFTATENTEHEDRSVTVTIKAGTTSKTFTISQKGKEEMLIPYLTFTADSTQTLTMSKAVATLEYSVNGEEWKELGTNVVSFGGNLGKLQLRGQNPEGTAKSNSDYSTISFGNDSPVNCFGDIRTLIDYKKHETVNTSTARFCSLFLICSNLISSPELPATTLASDCYYRMFNGCNNLTNAPKLPATILASNCYDSMFAACTNLTNAPELPATTLAEGCYSGMLGGCTNLTNAPKLPATTLAEDCYKFMFSFCTNLTNAPELPATTLAEGCYKSMFWGCTNLTNAPKLPATTLASDCYGGMFLLCTNLTNAPELPATTLAEGCYQSMFERCTNLTNLPQLPATTLANWCYGGMFNGCTKLTKAPELPATTLAEGCYTMMFNGCNSLSSITMLATNISAENCLNSWLEGVNASGTFTKSASMTSLPKGANGIPNGWEVKDYKEE